MIRGVGYAYLIRVTFFFVQNIYKYISAVHSEIKIVMNETALVDVSKESVS
jgi:hypothetical protein